MATWNRAGVVIGTIISAAIFSIIYYRVFVDHLAGMAKNQFSGPYTEVVTFIEDWAVAVVLILLFGTLVWFAVGGLQKERKREREVRRR